MKSIFLISLLFVTTSASADQTNTFRADASRVLNQATPDCLSKPSGISLAKIEKSVQSAPIAFARIEAGGREGALWTSQGIKFNPDLYTGMSQLARDVLSVHEFTGHAHGGYLDDGYPVSMYFALCAHPQYRGLLGKIAWPHNYVSKRFLLEKQGGSTVVGGGGDGRDIQLKLEAIEILASFYNNGERRFLAREIPDIIRGLLFVNFYRSEKASKEHFNLYIPNGVDRDFQAVVLVHPQTFDALFSANANARILQMAKLGIFFSDHVLSK